MRLFDAVIPQSTGRVPASAVQPNWGDIPVPLRMARVMRRQMELGLPTTEVDFLEAEETCDVSATDLHAQIGAAKRLIAQGADLPESDGMPARVARAQRMIGDLLPDDAEIVRRLRGGGFSAIEIGALWPHLMLATGRDFARKQRPAMEVA